MNEALREFGIEIGKLKKAFAEENNCNPNYVDIHIDDDNNVTIISTNSNYPDVYRCWLSTEEE